MITELPHPKYVLEIGGDGQEQKMLSKLNNGNLK